MTLSLFYVSLALAPALLFGALAVFSYHAEIRREIERRLNTRRVAVLRARWYCWRRDNVKLFLRSDGAVGIIFYCDGRPPLIDWQWRVPAPASFGSERQYDEYWRDGYLPTVPPSSPNCRCVFPLIVRGGEGTP